MLELDNNQLYKEVIMEHYKNPQNTNLIPNLKSWSIKNPVCGDKVTVQIELDKHHKIKAVHQQSIGCSISTASSSILSGLLVGKTIPQGIKIINDFVKMVKGEKIDNKSELGDAVVFEGVVNYPARFKCATVAWEIVLEALEELNK